MVEVKFSVSVQKIPKNRTIIYSVHNKKSHNRSHNFKFISHPSHNQPQFGRIIYLIASHNPGHPNTKVVAIPQKIFQSCDFFVALNNQILRSGVTRKSKQSKQSNKANELK